MTNRIRGALATGVGLAVLLVVVASCGDDSANDDATTTTTVDTGDTTTTTVPGASGIVWPDDDSVAFDDPIAAVTQFAVDFVGFVDPIVTDFRDGEPASVEVRPAPDGPLTTVYLRRQGAGWAVLGAATTNIVPTEPAPLDVVSSPLQLRGNSSALEGAVGVRVRDRSTGASLAESYVTGGAMEMGPFEGTLEYSDPTTPDGSVMLYANSMEDGGGVWEATVIAVEFAAP